jgi:hypothetical protein
MASYELREVAAGALPRGPVAGLVVAPGSVTLELPGRGRVGVAGGRVVVEAVSPAAGAALHAELRTWIQGQRWRQAGLLVFGGACVELGGRAVVLAARPRNGASFAALGLVRAGGRLVSDGVSAVRPGAGGFVALARRLPLELDARAIGPDIDLQVRPAGTGAGRVLLDVPHTTTETPVAAVVILVARINMRDIAVSAGGADTAPARLGITAVRDLSGPDRSCPERSRGDLAGLAAAVPVTTVLLPMTASTPESLADTVLAIVDLVGAA